MADNIDVTPGTGATVAADLVAGALHQRVKISQGADGSATDVSSAAPLEVTVANTGANATAIKVDGSAVTQPVSGSLTTVSTVTNLAQMGGQAINLGAGTGGSGTQRVIIDSAQIGSLGQTTASASTPVVLASDQSKIPVHGNTAHDAVDADKPIKIGGYASAAAPTSVSGDGDIVNGWYLRNGAAATVITAAGALVGGDATNGLDVDVTRIASGAIQSGAVASGAIASGAVASGAIASGAVASGAIASGAYASGSMSNVYTYNTGTVGATTLRVTLATDVALPAGELHIGEVGGKSAYRVITMTTDTSAYASGDLIADTQQYDAFFRKTDGTGVINTITITEKDAQGVAYYIIIHRTSTSMGTENSAPNISDANMVAGIQHIVTVAATDFVAVSGTKIATLKNLGLPVMAVSGTDDLYFSILNATGSPTYASGEIQLGIGVMLD